MQRTVESNIKILQPCLHHCTFPTRSPLAAAVTDINKNVASWRGCLNCSSDQLDLLFHHAPVVRAQHQYRDSASCQVLLVTNFLIGCDEKVKASFLSRRQQRPILEPGLSLKPRCNDDVPAVDEKAQLLRCTLVQNDLHAARDGSAGGTALLAAKSSTACTCSRVT